MMAPAMSTKPAMKVSHNATADLIGRLSVFDLSLSGKKQGRSQKPEAWMRFADCCLLFRTPASTIVGHKERLQTFERFHSGQALLRVGSRDVKQDTLHAN